MNGRKLCNVCGQPIMILSAKSEPIDEKTETVTHFFGCCNENCSAYGVSQYEEKTVIEK